ncbi:trichohyalin-like [Diabrotica virgifera virgifera]|uniref:CCHC-type domain-containing protein n=1 Tax=Diabrotica virgifera virgifera TaxID=50390 RepID=A0ABM5L7S5_DIAVI|nr:trichohyalin-like [Diabrotica virgifera virgifera]
MEPLKKPKEQEKKEDDYRQKKQDEAKTNKNENGEELSHDGKKTEEIEERKKFEEEMLKRHQNQPKINRSGPITHSTLLDNMLEETNREEEEKEEDAEEREPSAEAIEVEGEENKREEQTETHWQKTGDSILQALLFDDEDYEAIQQSKKRKGDSLEENERFKKEKREETAEYPEETENERILRKLKQVLEILNNKGPIQGEHKIIARNLIGEIYNQNKTSLNQSKKTQAEEESIRCEQCKIKIEREKQRKETEKIIEVLNKGGDINDFNQIYEKRWEETVYEKTKWEQGGLQETIAKKECLIVTKNEIKEDGIESVIRTIREEVHEIIEGCQEGNVEYIENGNRSSMATVRREWYTYVAKIKDQGIYEVAEKALKQIKERKEPPEIIRVAINNEINKEKVRKALEFVGRREKITWEIIIRGKEMDKEVKNEQEEALLIKTGSKSYTDVLKEMNAKINIGKIGVKVDRLKKTEGGDILVKLKGRGAAEKLKREMDTKMSGISMAVRRKENYFTITGLDPGVTVKILHEAIQAYTGISQDEVDIKMLRTNQHGEQVATIAVRPTKAEELRRYTTIAIGWVFCPIMERYTPMRCYKCLHYGHSTFECKGESRVACCYNCMKTGHTAVQCGNTAFCLTCNEEGHRMDRMQCPAYRAWVYGRGREREPPKGA